MSLPEKTKPVFTKHTAELYSNSAEPVQAEALYNDHSDRIKMFLQTRAPSADWVEEVMQDLYLKLMNVDDLSSIDNPAAYLTRMAHNLLIDAMRRRGREDKRKSEEPVETLELADPNPSLFEAAFSSQQIALCELALSELPDEYREILLLNRVDGLTHSQIAKRYDRSVSWVEKTIARTVLHCRRKLQEADR